MTNPDAIGLAIIGGLFAAVAMVVRWGIKEAQRMPRFDGQNGNGYQPLQPPSPWPRTGPPPPMLKIRAPRGEHNTTKEDKTMIKLDRLPVGVTVRVTHTEAVAENNTTEPQRVACSIGRRMVATEFVLAPSAIVVLDKWEAEKPIGVGDRVQYTISEADAAHLTEQCNAIPDLAGTLYEPGAVLICYVTGIDEDGRACLEYRKELGRTRFPLLRVLNVKRATIGQGMRHYKPMPDLR